MELFIIFFVWLALGAATAYLANQRGRDPFLWSMGVLTLSFFGLPFALMGVGALYFLPSIDDDEDVPEKHEFDEPEPVVSQRLAFDDIVGRDWFFYDQARERHGPVRFVELRAAWNEGLIKGDSYVWSEGVDVWKLVDEMPELLEALKSPPAETIATLDQ